MSLSHTFSIRLGARATSSLSTARALISRLSRSTDSLHSVYLLASGSLYLYCICQTCACTAGHSKTLLPDLCFLTLLLAMRITVSQGVDPVAAVPHEECHTAAHRTLELISLGQQVLDLHVLISTALPPAAALQVSMEALQGLVRGGTGCCACT